MRIITKLATAMRGGVRETAEVVIDANSLRIFAQEIHECENHINLSKRQLASIMAEKMRVTRDVEMLNKQIEKMEQRMADYLADENELAAMAIAETVSEKMALYERQQRHAEQLLKHEEKLQQTLQTMAGKLDNYRSELRMVKATGKMQSAQSRLASHSCDAVSRFGDMQDSLSRIQEKQQSFSDEMTAMDQINTKLSGGFVDDVSDALKESAQEILQRVKSKTSLA